MALSRCHDANADRTDVAADVQTVYQPLPGNISGRKILLVALRCHARNQLVLIGVILSTLSSSPLLVVTYRAPSGPVRAARSRP